MCQLPPSSTASVQCISDTSDFQSIAVYSWVFPFLMTRFTAQRQSRHPSNSLLSLACAPSLSGPGQGRV